MWCFYYIQNDEGESAAHPNAFLLPSNTPEKHVTFGQIIDNFPLKDTGTFIFRFKSGIQSNGSNENPNFVYLDIYTRTARIPLYRGHVHAKILRLENATCVSRNTPRLMPKKHTKINPTPDSNVQSKTKQTVPSTQNMTQSVHASQSVTKEASSRTNEAQNKMSAMQTQAPTSQTSINVMSDNLLSSRASAEQSFSTISFQQNYTQTQVHIEVPEHVDADLYDKSDYVKATVMARRNEQRKRQQDAVAAVEEAEKAKLAEQNAMDLSRQKIGTKLEEWMRDKHGQPRTIQALISTLDTVLWDKSGWTPAAKSALVDPKKLRIAYFKACRIVHPDRIGPDADADTKYIARTVFQALNKSYKVYEEAQA